MRFSLSRALPIFILCCLSLESGEPKKLAGRGRLRVRRILWCLHLLAEGAVRATRHRERTGRVRCGEIVSYACMHDDGQPPASG